MQTIAVYVIVVLAALYAAWRLMPRAVRGRLGQSVVTFGRRHARLSEDDATALARRLSAGGCGACDNCGTCGTAKPAATRATVHFVAEQPREMRG